MYQYSKKLVTYKKYSCFDHFDFPAHSVFRFDLCWGSLGTSIFRNSSSAANNTRSRLPFRLSFRFLWLWRKEIENRTTRKIKTGYYLELLTLETIILLWSTKNKITKNENRENVRHLEMTEVVLPHYNIFENDYQYDLNVLYIFAF